MDNNDLYQLLRNKRSLRAKLRELPFEDVAVFANNMKIVFAEIESQRELEIQNQQEKEAKLQEYAKEITAAGISPEELVAALTKGNKPKSKRKPRPEKYEYMVNGVRKTWTGQGRTPSAIATAMENEGKSIEDFLIK